MSDPLERAIARKRRELSGDEIPFATEPEPEPTKPADVLRFLTLAEMRRRAASPAGFLIDTLWPDDAYGVLGAEDKAGKTWAICDLGVSIATGTPWLGRFDCQQGPVLLLYGEGGNRNLLRRLDAISVGREVELDDEALRVALAVPRLGNRAQLDAVKRDLDTHRPRAVLLDPLYLAAPGGKGRDLYAMGEALGAIQGICQEAGSALVVNAHWNKTGEGTGAARFTGVGPGAWGRVLGSAAVEQRHVDVDGRSTVTLLWEFSGGEIPETRFRLTRRVWVDDQHSLSSPMHYEVEVTQEGPEAIPTDLNVTQDRVLAALRGGGERTVKQIGDALARDKRGKPLRARTIQKHLHGLAEMGLVDGEGEEGKAGRWWAL
jgi:hypothetical protein